MHMAFNIQTLSSPMAASTSGQQWWLLTQDNAHGMLMVAHYSADGLVTLAPHVIHHDNGADSHLSLNAFFESKVVPLSDGQMRALFVGRWRLALVEHELDTLDKIVEAREGVFIVADNIVCPLAMSYVLATHGEQHAYHEMHIRIELMDLVVDNDEVDGREALNVQALADAVPTPHVVSLAMTVHAHWISAMAAHLSEPLPETTEASMRNLQRHFIDAALDQTYESTIDAQLEHIGAMRRGGGGGRRRFSGVRARGRRIKRRANRSFKRWTGAKSTKKSSSGHSSGIKKPKPKSSSSSSSSSSHGLGHNKSKSSNSANKKTKSSSSSPSSKNKKSSTSTKTTKHGAGSSAGGSHSNKSKTPSSAHASTRPPPPHKPLPKTPAHKAAASTTTNSHPHGQSTGSGKPSGKPTHKPSDHSTATTTTNHSNSKPTNKSSSHPPPPSPTTSHKSGRDKSKTASGSGGTSGGGGGGGGVGSSGGSSSGSGNQQPPPANNANNANNSGAPTGQPDQGGPGQLGQGGMMPPPAQGGPVFTGGSGVAGGSASGDQQQQQQQQQQTNVIVIDSGSSGKKGNVSTAQNQGSGDDDSATPINSLLRDVLYEWNAQRVAGYYHFTMPCDDDSDLDNASDVDVDATPDGDCDIDNSDDDDDNDLDDDGEYDDDDDNDDNDNDHHSHDAVPVVRIENSMMAAAAAMTEANDDQTALIDKASVRNIACIGAFHALKELELIEGDNGNADMDAMQDPLLAIQRLPDCIRSYIANSVPADCDKKAPYLHMKDAHRTWDAIRDALTTYIMAQTCYK